MSLSQYDRVLLKEIELQQEALAKLRNEGEEERTGKRPPCGRHEHKDLRDRVLRVCTKHHYHVEREGKRFCNCGYQKGTPVLKPRKPRKTTKAEAEILNEIERLSRLVRTKETATA